MNEIIDFKNKIDYKKIEQIGYSIKNGGVVVFPTETVYGIGTNGLNEKAVEKLYKIKQRPLTKPISLLVSNFEMIDIIAKDVTEIEYKIMKKFFPGPLTIILNKKDCVPSIVTANGDTVGVRMPENDIALQIIEKSGVPIATPSANISGKPSGTNIKMIMQDFKNQVDYFIDNGESKIGRPSTIIKVENEQIKVLRQGSITKEQIIKEIF